jgi:hypothetical protein
MIQTSGIRRSGPWTRTASPRQGFRRQAQRVVHLLSGFYQWLGKHHGVSGNPVRALKGDEDIRDLLKPTHDPKRVPFLRIKGFAGGKST